MKMPSFSTEDGYRSSGHVPLMYGHSAYRPFTEVELARALQAQARRDRQVAAATLARHDDACAVDPPLLGVGVDPLEPRDAVVEPARVRRDLGDRRGLDGVAELDKHHGHAVGRDDTCPRAVVAIEARQVRHGAAVDVVHARDGLIVVGTHDLELDRVAVGLEVTSCTE